MRERQDAILPLGVEIDEQVAAAHQIHLRVRRIGEQVLRREDDGFTDLALDAIALAGLLEEAIEPVGREPLDHAAGIEAAARGGEIVVGKVRGEDFRLQALFSRFGMLGEQHCDRIGFLARRAGRNPGADRLVGRRLLDERPDHVAVEGLPRFGIAEEAGDVDHHVADERLQLGGIVAELDQIVIERFRARRAPSAGGSAVSAWCACTGGSRGRCARG